MGPAGDEGHDAHDDEDPLGDQGDDNSPRGAPPDRLDRLWVHPAELSAEELRAAPVPPTPRSRWAGVMVPVAAGALGAIVAVLVLGLVGAFDGQGDDQSDAPVAERVAAGDAALSEFAQAVAPGLLVVTVTDARGTRQSTGVGVRHRGDVLTSAATVGNATTAEITTTTGEQWPAKVVGRDDVTGLVLLDAQRPVRAVPVSESAARAGDSIWIFGAAPPDQSSAWISSGIVSSVDALLANAPGPMTGGLVETDALGTVWTAGGALVDRTGGVSGIVLWPQGDRGGSYAVPIRRAVDIADELREKGSVAHGALPLETVDTPAGPQVTAVPAGGPAARAGLRTGDVIVAVDEREILDSASLVAVVRAYDPGTEVEVEFVRAGEPMKTDVTLGSTAPEG